MKASIQLKKNGGRDYQGACREEELIGSKPPVVNNSDSDSEFNHLWDIRQPVKT
jgi:hypothetical protein